MSEAPLRPAAEAATTEVNVAVQQIPGPRRGLDARAASDCDSSARTTADDSLVQQLHALYDEKQQLEQAIGTSEPAAVVRLATLGSSADMVVSLMDQLAALYSDREQLYAALGVSSVTEVIAVVTQLRRHLAELSEMSRRRILVRQQVLDEQERLLSAG